MKKSLIATGAASLALAAMPALGAFAAVTDTVQLTIASSCSVGGAGGSSSSTGKTITEPAAVNSHLYQYDANGTNGGTLKVTCNNASGWQVKAVGAGEGSPNTSMKPSGSGTAIVTGTATSGDDSNWAFKIAGTTGVTVPTTYASYAAVPATETTVATGSAAVNEGTIYTGYQVWVSATQQADTYTGKVTYTIVPGNS